MKNVFVHQNLLSMIKMQSFMIYNVNLTKQQEYVLFFFFFFVFLLLSSSMNNSFFNQDLNDAEQQIYILQRDKLTLIKTITTLQETKPSPGGGDHSAAAKRTGFITRN